jgi:transposase
LRPGAAYFLQPDSSQQRRYEALRAYFVEDLPASQVADRYGYSTASVHQMATLLRSGKLQLFAHTKPGPKGPRKATGELRTKILRLRAHDHSVTEIASALTADGLPVSAQTVWQVLQAEGLPRLPRRDEGRRGSPTRLEVVKATKLGSWPAPTRLPCDHAGLLLLFPAMADLGLHELVRKAGYPSTTALSAWQSIASLLLAKCARRPRVHHLGALTDDAGLAFALGLSALPKATHLGSYSYRVRRQSNQQLLAGLVGALRPLGLATGEAGFNLDFHAIRHHGQDTMLEKHYVPRRSQRTRAVLTFFAQDHTSAEMVYAGADITTAEQAREIIAFADYWQQATGADPGLLVFDSQLTTYAVLDELTSRGIRWLTLRQRGTRSWTGWPPCPPRHGNQPAWTAPAATATPTCTRTRSGSKASTPRSARSPSATSAATSPPYSSATTTPAPARTCLAATPNAC